MLSRTKVPFGQRVRTSNQILGEVRRFLNAERDLWVFPLLATLAFGAFLVPATMWGASRGLGMDGFSGMARSILIFTVLGFPLMYLMSLLNTAFAFAVWGRMEGQHTTKREGWARALKSAGPLLRYNLIAAVIGLVLGVVGIFLDRLRLVPGLASIANLVGAYGWALASYFVIPVIAVERERRAVGAIRRSVKIVRGQFGTSVTGFITIQLVLMLVFIPIVLVSTFGTILVLMPWLASNGVNVERVFSGIFISAVFGPMLLMWVISQALNTTYQTALYRFAVTGRITHPFSVATLHTAWEPYRKR